MTQIMGLLNRVRRHLREDPVPASDQAHGRDAIRETGVRLIAATLDWQKQRRVWATLKRNTARHPPLSKRRRERAVDLFSVSAASNTWSRGQTVSLTRPNLIAHGTPELSLRLLRHQPTLKQALTDDSIEMGERLELIDAVARDSAGTAWL